MANSARLENTKFRLNVKSLLHFMRVSLKTRESVLLKNAGAAIELWDRQLEAAWLSKEQQDKLKNSNLFSII